jgi:hypothetical protein
MKHLMDCLGNWLFVASSPRRFESFVSNQLAEKRNLLLAPS